MNKLIAFAILVILTIALAIGAAYIKPNPNASPDDSTLPITRAEAPETSNENDKAQVTLLEEKTIEEATIEPQLAPDPQAQSLSQSVNNLIAPLDEPNKNHFLALYNAHNLTNVIRVIRKDVINASQACINAHDDLKSPLTVALSQWQYDVDAALEDADSQIQNMVIAQDYSDTKEVKDLLKLSQKLRENQEADMDKQPVTTREVCDTMEGVMAATKNSLITSLKDALLLLPHAALATQK